MRVISARNHGHISCRCNAQYTSSINWLITWYTPSVVCVMRWCSSSEWAAYLSRRSSSQKKSHEPDCPKRRHSSAHTGTTGHMPYCRSLLSDYNGKPDTTDHTWIEIVEERKQFDIGNEHVDVYRQRMLNIWLDYISITLEPVHNPLDNCTKQMWRKTRVHVHYSQKPQYDTTDYDNSSESPVLSDRQVKSVWTQMIGD